MKFGARNAEARLLNCLVSDVYSGYRPERDEPFSQPAVPTTDFQNPRPFKIQRGAQAENLIAPAARFFVDGLQVLRIPGILRWLEKSQSMLESNRCARGLMTSSFQTRLFQNAPSVSVFEASGIRVALSI